MPGLRRSVWITEGNVARLKDLSTIMRFDNDNKVINAIIEDYANYLKYKKAIQLFQELMKELKL